MSLSIKSACKIPCSFRFSEMPKKLCFAMAVLGSSIAQPSFANNVGENAAWQFQTPADRAALMYLEEVRQRGINGYYSAPVYNTYIDDQYNCSVNSTATGNDSASNAVANSPSTTGHNTDATGNQNDTTYAAGGPGDGSTDTTTQGNSGAVAAGSSGSMSTSVRGDNFQALNTRQTNSGNQTSTINGSSACQYAEAG
jgi:hypothetical protein